MGRSNKYPPRLEMPRPRRSRYPSKQTKNRWDKSGQCYLCGSLTILPPVPKKRNICQTCYLKRSASSALGSSSLWTILLDKLNKQKWRCAYTGIPLILRENASIDHILPISRYPQYRNNPNNVEWVDWRVNHMKLSMTKDEFISFSRKISKRNT